MKLLQIIFFCVIITLSSTKKLKNLCPAKEVIQNFDSEKYLGKWFLINRYDDIETKRRPACVVSEYLRDSEGQIKTILTFIDDSNVKQSSESLVILNPSGSGQLSTLEKPSGKIVPNYNILETDYKNYAIVWKCRNTGENQSEGKILFNFFIDERFKN